MAYRVRVIPKKKRRTMQPGTNGTALDGLQVIEDGLACPLVRESIFRDLPRPVLTALDVISSSAIYPKGAILFAEGQAACGVFILGNGRVRLSTTSADGRSIIVRIAEPGQAVGLAAALSGKSHELTAETLEPVHANFIPREAFLHFLRGHGQAAVRVAEILSEIYHAALLEVRYLSVDGGGDKSKIFTFNWFEDWAGRESRTIARNQNNDGFVFGERVAATADFGATWHFTNNLRFIDSFHYSNFHNPAEFDASTCSFFSPNLLTPANLFSPGAGTSLPVSCVSPSDGTAGTPAHSASSGPDVSVAASSLFLKQDEKMNLAEIEYQFSPRLGTRVGFRYRHRSINDKALQSVTEVFFPTNANRGDYALVNGALPEGCTPNGDGSFTFITPQPVELDTGETLINEYAGLFGIWAKPLANWRISFDTELMSADNTFTRISPRQTQEYRLRTTYKPAAWANLSGSVTIWEGRNNVAEINNLQHNRIYGISAAFEPRESFGLELGYDYNDVFSQILICYTSSAPPPGLEKCPGSTLVQQLSTYTNASHYGYFDVNWTPWKRLTTRLGANLTRNSGSVLIITPNAPSGPLNSTYYQPFAGIDYRFAKGWTGKAYWGYYGYHEDSSGVPQDVFVPRNFQSNLVTLSVRYAF
jgi:cyclic nucleotide-binding protein